MYLIVIDLLIKVPKMNTRFYGVRAGARTVSFLDS